MEETKKAGPIDLWEGLALLLLLLFGIILLFFRYLVPFDAGYSAMFPLIVWGISFFVYILFEGRANVLAPDPTIVHRKKLFFYGEAASCLVGLVLGILCWTNVIGGDAGDIVSLVAGLCMGYPMYLVKLILEIKAKCAKGEKMGKSQILPIALLVGVFACLAAGIALPLASYDQGLFFFMAMPLFLLVEKGRKLD